MRRGLLSLLLLGVLFPTIVWAGGSEETLLKCLGREEASIHRHKASGVLYQLNQQMIASLTTANQLTLRPLYRIRICHHPKLSVSVALLKALLLYGERLFLFKEKDQHQYGSFAANQLLIGLPNIFFNYLSGLQRYAKSANCLPSKLPHLSYFIERFKYLEGHLTTAQLLQEKRKLKELFDALPLLDQILKSCEPSPKKVKTGAKR